MKIKEFLIVRYGPLKNKGPFQLKNFNLFFGKNEEGKTLTIDALVKLLLGKNIRDFEHIDRVEEKPQGYVIIEDDNGKEIKLPEKEDLAKVTDLNSSELRNIFIIRNSDLSIAKENEFYLNITDRLTGLRSKDILEIKNNLREIGKLTPTGTFRDTKEERLKTRIENAKALIEEIKNLNKEIIGKRFDKLEEEIIELKQKKEKIEQEIKEFQDARKRETYEKAKEAIEKLKEALAKYRELETYNENDAELWRICEEHIRMYNEDKNRLIESLKKEEENLNKIIEELSIIEKDFNILNERKKRLDEDIKPKLTNYEEEFIKLAGQKTKNKFFVFTGIFSSVIFLISLIGIILMRYLWLKPLMVFSLALVLISGIFIFLFLNKKGLIEKKFQQIKLELSKFGLQEESIEKVCTNIQKFEEEHSNKSSQLQDTKRKKDNLEEKIKELKDKKIPEKELMIEEEKRKINQLQLKAKVNSYEEYKNKLFFKQKYKEIIESQKSILESLFRKVSSNNLEENIRYWINEINRLEVYNDKAKDIKYNDIIESERIKEKAEVEERMNSVYKTMETIQKKMEEIERKVNDVLSTEKSEYLFCKTSIDLEAIQNKLQKFVQDNEEMKNNVLEVIRIFDEIEKDEKEKVSKLFGKDSLVSQYFSEITNNFYKEVIFDQEGKVVVKQANDTILEAEKLSGGAYDQLYFSIRLTLADKLLSGKKGFFIMDDPFIKSDFDRLQREMEMLKKIAKLGWQIVYFSAKDEIYESLKKDIDSGFVNYIKISN